MPAVVSFRMAIINRDRHFLRDFFAAPCGALIGGMYFGRINGKIALLSIISGLLTGFGTWLFKENGWFVGSILSLIVPIAVMITAALFEKDRYNFYRLRQYRG